MPAPETSSRGAQRPSFGLPARDDTPTGAAPTGAGATGVPTQADEQPPVCPRHPDRVSYVRCRRCGRPACGECQRPTPVGMICVDCERDLARLQAGAAPRTALGGRASGMVRPLVTYSLIGLCVVLFLGQMVGGGVVEQLLAFTPARSLLMPWTFVTSGFLHGGLAHIALNMFALWSIGQYLERAMGPVRFLALFLLSVIGGHVAVLLLTSVAGQGWMTIHYGASGGIFGLFAAMFVIGRRTGADIAGIAVVLVLNLVLTFTMPGISWQGHLGGLVTGAAVTAALFAVRPQARPGADRAALARHAATRHALVLGGAAVILLLLVAVKVVTTGTPMFGLI
ncbi:rhomboid family intramembrane serine protease [Brachybacterium sp. EF45031]|nr:rhomboid family intramembrane serine protease [Brachybacterium sillae]